MISDSMRKQLEEAAEKSKNGIIKNQVTPDMPDEQSIEPLPEVTPNRKK